jgi:serine protease Do
MVSNWAKPVLAIWVLGASAAIAASQQAPAPPPEPPAPKRAPRVAVVSSTSSRPYLGVGVADVNAERAERLKLKQETGVEITTVTKDSPAEKAGLQKGDVVLEYNNERVESMEQFVRLVRETPVGRTVKLLVSREGQPRTINATLGRRSAAAVAVPNWNPEMFGESLERLKGLERGFVMPDLPKSLMSWRNRTLGIEAEALGPQLAEYFGVKQGVLIRAVTKGSAAEKAGMRAGDVITAVEGKAVSAPHDVTSAVRAELTGKKQVGLTIRRNHKEMSLNVALDESSAAPQPRGFRAIPLAPQWQGEFAEPLVIVPGKVRTIALDEPMN